MTDTPWHVYLLECADGSWYCGIARDLRRRIAQHNGQISGGARYTASRRPVSLLACALLPSRSEAQKLEYRVKQMPRPKKLTTLGQMDRPDAKP